MSGEMCSHYSVLNCEENASKEELRKQYKKLVLKTHPDKTDSTDFEEFHRIDRAIKVLDNDLTRRQYDSQLIENRSESHIINAEICLNECTHNCETKMYSTDCRCGGSYDISENELSIAKTQSHIIVDCNSCSLSVRLKF